MMMKEIIPRNISLSDVYVYRLEVPPSIENLVIMNNIKKYVYENNLFIISPISISPYSLDLIKVNNSGLKYNFKDCVNLIADVIDKFKPIGCSLYIVCGDPVKKISYMFISFGKGIDKMISAIDKESTDDTIINLYNYILNPYGIELNKNIIEQLKKLWKNLKLLEG